MLRAGTCLSVGTTIGVGNGRGYRRYLRADGGELLMPGMGKVVVARDGERGMADAPFPSWALDRTDSSELLAPEPSSASLLHSATRPSTPSSISRSSIGPRLHCLLRALPFHVRSHISSTADSLELRLLPSVDRPRTLNLEPLCARAYIDRGRSAHANLRITAGLEAGLRRPTLSHWTDGKGV